MTLTCQESTRSKLSGLSPVCTILSTPPVASLMLGNAYYMLKEYALALPAVRDCVLRAPNLRGGHVGLAIIYAQLGEIEKARAEAAEVLRIQPTYTNSGTTSWRTVNALSLA